MYFGMNIYLAAWRHIMYIIAHSMRSKGNHRHVALTNPLPMQIIVPYHSVCYVNSQGIPLYLHHALSRHPNFPACPRLLYATENSCIAAMIHFVGTDVLVFSISAIQLLSIDELWFAFATGKIFRYLSAHGIAEKSSDLPFLHAFTGCDMVFTGRGKMTVLGNLEKLWRHQSWIYCITINSKLCGWQMDDWSALSFFWMIILVMLRR